MSAIYLDNHATTRCDRRVVEAMLPMFEEYYANPGSVTHVMGRHVEELVANARQRVATCLNCEPNEIVFTSGSTESNCLAIEGIADRKKCGHVLSVSTEHPSVISVIRKLERRGFTSTLMSVAPNDSAYSGTINVDDFKIALRPDTILASVMWANNEVGTLQPIESLVNACQDKKVPLHCDATQAVGKISLDLAQTPIAAMSFSGHKIHGPKGIGVLFVRGGASPVRFNPIVTGGGQERGRRGGTLNVPGIVGLATALEIANMERVSNNEALLTLRDDLWNRLKSKIPDLVLNGPSLPNQRLPNNLNVQFPMVDGHTLMSLTPNVCVSSGSACTATSTEPSHVLQALGLDPDAVRSSIRFGLSRFTTSTEIEFAADELTKSYQRLQATHC